MDITPILFSFAQYTPFVAFGLMLLSGCNVPISEEVVLLVSGSIASTLAPGLTCQIFLGCWLGVYLSDIMVYLTGRYLGRRILKTKWGKRIIPISKVNHVSLYLHKYGVATFLIGRIVPFGFRNFMFTAAGLAKMNIVKFLLADVIPLTVTTTLNFYLGYLLGENYEELYPYLDKMKYIIVFVFLGIFILLLWRIVLLHKIKQGAVKRAKAIV